jgi:hypothetical protein
MFFNEYICVVTKLVTISIVDPYDRFCRSFNINFSYSYVCVLLSYQDHMTREEADLEWRAMMDYWAGSRSE